MRMWSGIRRYVGAIAGWYRTRRDKHSAYGHHIKSINVFLENDTQHAQHAWKMLDEKEKLRIQCELLFFLGIVDPIFEETSNETEERNETGLDLLKALDECVDKARCRGKEQLEEQKAKTLAISLQGGASKAHKAVNVDNALPPLRLTIQPNSEEQRVEYISSPVEVAKF